MTPEEAKKIVWDHWDSLNGLAKRRFPGNEGLAEQATLFALDKLGADEWHRVRKWQGKVTFVAFLSVAAKRLFTDFEREKYGYHREPKWLREIPDPLWHKAYRMYATENLDRRAVIEILASDVSRERRYIEEVVSTLVARCRPVVKPKEESHDETVIKVVPNGHNPGPQQQSIDEEHQDAIQVLIAYISDGDATKLSAEMRDWLSKLQALDLSEEDRLIVKLREIENVQLQAIKKMLHYHGDIYKRYKKILRQIRNACERSGLFDA